MIDMQLCRLSITWYGIGCRKRTLTFRSFVSGFATLNFTGFARIPMFTMGLPVPFLKFPRPQTFFLASYLSLDLALVVCEILSIVA